MIQPTDNKQGFWLITQAQNIYFPQHNLPFGTAEELGLQHKLTTKIGEWDNAPLYLLLEEDNAQYDWIALRSLLNLPKSKFNLLNRGVELNHFYNTHKFCGKCGHETEMPQNEWAVQCKNSSCLHRTYPVICPSIIVAIRKDDCILLASHRRHMNNDGRAGLYTVLAGFVEVGETFEQTVEREVFEESGIKIKNIRYFGSQPWAFPNAQMVGFLADYDSGDIQVQEEEIVEAKWFKYNEPLPQLPEHGTIARELIETTLQLCANAN
ncbi:NAD(+) diphosphatase [Pasteurellaceae bacterium 22721_9_1]